MGPHQHLVNNAVQFNVKGLLTMSLEEFRRQTDIVLSGSFLFARAVAEVMMERGGAEASSMCFPQRPGRVSRATSATARAERTETSPGRRDGTRGVESSMDFANGEDAHRPELLRRLAEPAPAVNQYPMDFHSEMPLNRLQNPEDYVAAVVFLAPEESAMIAAPTSPSTAVPPQSTGLGPGTERPSDPRMLRRRSRAGHIDDRGRRGHRVAFFPTESGEFFTQPPHQTVVARRRR